MTTSDTRVRFRDLKPYATVEHLDDLHGPSEGVVTLPLDLFWSGDPRFDLADAAAREYLYQSVLTNGSVEDLEHYLNHDLLRHLWPGLWLDERLVRTWHARHPSLATLRPASQHA